MYFQLNQYFHHMPLVSVHNKDAQSMCSFWQVNVINTYFHIIFASVSAKFVGLSDKSSKNWFGPVTNWDRSSKKLPIF